MKEYLRFKKEEEKDFKEIILKLVVNRYILKILQHYTIVIYKSYVLILSCMWEY